MYAVAVNGSPRKGGNTKILLNVVLDELKNSGWETELVKVGGTSIRGIAFTSSHISSFHLSKLISG